MQLIMCSLVLFLSAGVDALMVGCKIGKSMKEKLLKVLEWVQRTKSAFRNTFHSNQVRQMILSFLSICLLLMNNII